MRTLLQIVCILAIALGVGLIVAGGVYKSADHSKDPLQMARSLQRSDWEAQHERSVATYCYGFGSAFLTLGTLGVVIPWINMLVYGRRTGVAPPPPSPA